MGQTMNKLDNGCTDCGRPHSSLVPCDPVPVVAVDPDAFDDKGRVRAEFLSDRALLIEAVVTMRQTQDMVHAFIEDFAKNPMLSMLMKRGK